MEKVGINEKTKMDKWWSTHQSRVLQIYKNDQEIKEKLDLIQEKKYPNDRYIVTQNKKLLRARFNKDTGEWEVIQTADIRPDGKIRWEKGNDNMRVIGNFANGLVKIAVAGTVIVAATMAAPYIMSVGAFAAKASEIAQNISTVSKNILGFDLFGSMATTFFNWKPDYMKGDVYDKKNQLIAPPPTKRNEFLEFSNNKLPIDRMLSEEMGKSINPNLELLPDQVPLNDPIGTYVARMQGPPEVPKGGWNSIPPSERDLRIKEIQRWELQQQREKDEKLNAYWLNKEKENPKIWDKPDHYRYNPRNNRDFPKEDREWSERHENYKEGRGYKTNEEIIREVREEEIRNRRLMTKAGAPSPTSKLVKSAASAATSLGVGVASGNPLMGAVHAAKEAPNLISSLYDMYSD